EQICIYACPWPRIQAAMMDEDTITIAYRDWRGEPRGKHRKAEGAEVLGDCIDCNACVNVCPMGIDIRNGQQMECITCALCIDACDEVMEKIGKPRGLIDYIALSDETRERAGAAALPAIKHVFRPRVILYTALWSLIGVGLLVALLVRSEVDLNIQPIRNPTFIAMSDGTIRNSYDMRVLNKMGEARPFAVTIEADEPLEIVLQGVDGTLIEVPADTTFLQRLYIDAAPGSPASRRDRTELRIVIEDMTTGARAHFDTVFNGRVQ
ncbi:MAG: 4Fe-4S dicluster domain-containing protein, partial [Rhodobacteraceae bacterium]|nr:4Fe-4S dicluster domain-containing protein [Paracoccaceae bacterium]